MKDINNIIVGIILMDLSKAYDCISHELSLREKCTNTDQEKLRIWTLLRSVLIAKLECFDLDEISLKLILNYLGHRKQKTNIGSSSVLGLTYALASHRAQNLVFFILLYLLMICFLML